MVLIETLQILEEEIPHMIQVLLYRKFNFPDELWGLESMQIK